MINSNGLKIKPLVKLGQQKMFKIIYFSNFLLNFPFFSVYFVLKQEKYVNFFKNYSIFASLVLFYFIITQCIKLLLF